jgi:hypothetical protein
MLWSSFLLALRPIFFCNAGAPEQLSLGSPLVPKATRESRVEFKKTTWPKILYTLALSSECGKNEQYFLDGWGKTRSRIKPLPRFHCTVFLRLIRTKRLTDCLGAISSAGVL